jgi:seryl-tRNA synthetase
MASQKSNNNSTESRTTQELKKNKSNAGKQHMQSNDKTKPKISFKKEKKISKSIKRMESEISQIQKEMARIGKDLTGVLDLIQTKKKS